MNRHDPADAGERPLVVLAELTAEELAVHMATRRAPRRPAPVAPVRGLDDVPAIDTYEPSLTPDRP